MFDVAVKGARSDRETSSIAMASLSRLTWSFKLPLTPEVSPD